MNYILYKKCLIFDDAPHLEKQLNRVEMGNLLRKNNAYFIRNLYNWDCKRETSFWNIIKDNFGGLEELSSNTRRKIRRAQKLLDIKIVDKQIIREQGYLVYLASFKKYKNIITQPVSEEKFLDGLNAYHNGEQFWGCLDRSTGKLIAYSSNSIKDGMCNYSSLKAIPEYLTGYYPFYGLLYSMNEYYLKTIGLKYVSDGERSITKHSNIQPFLVEKFGFRRAYCMLSIRYVWWLKIFITMLFPFRKFIPNLKIRALFRQEEMVRNLV